MTDNHGLNGQRPGIGAGRLVSVPVLLAALRRRWAIAMTGAVLGALAALAFSLAMPPPHAATTTLLLQHETQADSARAMLTDARLSRSRPVAQAVIKELGLQMSPQELMDQYEPSILSDVLLQIKVTAPSDAEAVRRAEAVARSFLAFRRDELQRQADLAVQNLEERQRQLNAELIDVNEEINARSGARGDEAVRALGDLLVRRATLNEQVGGVRQRIEAATFGSDSIVERSRVIDPAGEAERSPLRVAVVNTVAGVILGLHVTSGGIMLHEATSDRLRRREDVARALRAPVAASIGALRGPTWRQRRRFARLLASPPADVLRAVDRVREALQETRTGKLALVVVSVDSDGAAALVLAATTLRLMQEERSVLIVDLTRRNVLARLTNVRPEERDRLPLGADRSALWVNLPPHQVSEPDRADPSSLFSEFETEVDVVLALATVDPAVGARHLAEVAGSAVVVTTAGRSTETALRSVAEMIEAAGLRLVSTVLAGADRRDESAGLLGGRYAGQRATRSRIEARP